MFKVSRKTRPSFASGFARSQAEAANPGLWNGLVGAWIPLLGPTGKTLRDISGAGKHGTLTGMDPATDWTVGENGWQLDFDGNNDCVDATATTALAGARRYTFSFWLLGVSYDTNEPVLGFRNGTDTGDVFLFYPYSDGHGIRVFQNGTGRYNEGDVTRSPTAWRHFAIVGKSITSADIYVDDCLLANYNPGGSLSATPTNITIAGWHPNAQRTNCSVATVQAHNRALAPSEIKQLYEDPHAITRQRPRIFAVTSRQKRWPWQTRRQRRMAGAR